jgi:photosystem II stability/assembly factor-like uncharacterized protein
MLATVLTSLVHGLDGRLVEVQVDVSAGVSGFTLVGLASGSVREARDRVRSAIRNSGLPFPQRRLTVNLAPAGLRKDGPSLDLASAVAYLHPSPLPGRPASRPTTASVPPPVTARLLRLQVASPTVAWVCLLALRSGAGLVYATLDGGRTWRSLKYSWETANPKFGAQVIDVAHGTLQLGDGLYATSDGGRAWHRVPLPPGERFGLGAHFLTPSVGWYLDLAVYQDLAQQPTAMWWTSDQGASWSELWRVDSQHPESGGVPLNGIKYVLGFRDASTGWLGVRQSTSSRLPVTGDGGHVWSPVDLPLNEPADLTSLELLSDGSAVLLARTSTAWLALPSRDGGRTWEEGRSVPIATAPSGAGQDRPSFMDHDHWAVANGSRLHVTSDAGRTWRDVSPARPPGITALHDLWLTVGGPGWATAEDAGGNLRVLHAASALRAAVRPWEAVS